MRRLLFILFVIGPALQGCWVTYFDNPTYRPEVTDAYKSPPTGPVDHLTQWVGQMYDAKLALEILDGRCQTPTVYSDLEFQIRRGDSVLMKRQLDKKSFVAKIYLEKGEYKAILISFSRNSLVGEKTFLFEGQDKQVSIEVKCR